MRVTLLCAQKSLLCGSTEPSDHSGPACAPAAGAPVSGVRDGEALGSRGSREALGVGSAGVGSPGAGSTGEGTRRVATVDGAGGEVGVVAGVGGTAAGCCGGTSFTTEAMP
ncbi:hypothetical protein ACFVYR_07890 [Streptomyces sp. NPDC058284]|uniref:hypothetical protein n=1 Tax=unclassified Streptomyces TaxID=2593676 RepID=UPI0036618D08